MRWSIAGRSLATTAVANQVAAQLWNPSTTRACWVTQISVFQTGAVVSNLAVKRSTVKGATPTTTVTPTIANDWERKIIPPTVAVLELATFTTAPTLDGTPLFQANNPATAGSGFILPFESAGTDGIEIPPASGLCVYTPVAVILQPGDFTFFLIE